MFELYMYFKCNLKNFSHNSRDPFHRNHHIYILCVCVCMNIIKLSHLFIFLFPLTEMKKATFFLVAVVLVIFVITEIADNVEGLTKEDCQAKLSKSNVNTDVQSKIDSGVEM